MRSKNPWRDMRSMADRRLAVGAHPRRCLLEARACVASKEAIHNFFHRSTNVRTTCQSVFARPNAPAMGSIQSSIVLFAQCPNYSRACSRGARLTAFTSSLTTKP
jgi:hypothetical protein